MTRQQMFSHVHRPQAVQQIALGAAAGGQLESIVNNATTATSRFENYMESVVNWGLMNYACPDASGKYDIAPMDTSTPGDMRAPGAATGMNLFEIAMDEMAYAAGVDPLALRRLNYAERDAMEEREFTSKNLREAYDQGAAAFGWAARSMAPRSMRDGSELVGWGMATGVWDAMFMKTAARARFDDKGVLEIASATADIGTGTYTVMAQVAGGVLGLPLERMRVKLGDSDLPAAPVEGGSWGAASTGAAVQLACEALARQFFKVAGKMDGAPLGKAAFDEVTFEDGDIVVKARARSTGSGARRGLRLGAASYLLKHRLDVPQTLRRRFGQRRESEEERDYLSSVGIDMMQGYIFARPSFKTIGDVDPRAWGAAAA